MKENLDDQMAADIIRDFERKAASRGNLESQWQEIAERAIPSHSANFSASSIGSRVKGERRTDNIYDSTLGTALNRFTAIIDSLLTPQNSQWHGLTATNPAIAKDRQARLYFEEATRVIFKHRYAARANFIAQNQGNFLSLGAYGTGAVFTDKIYGGIGLRYKNIHLSEIFFSENHQGIIDQADRKFALTARQAVEKWGEKCPDKIKEAAKGPNPDMEFTFIHCVKQRKDYDPNRRDTKGMKFGSYYVSIEGKKMLQEEGFSTFPYAASRYYQSENEVYGRSIAMEVLPSTKTLNEMKKTLLIQGQRTVNPILLGHDDGVLSFDMRPGAANSGGVSADGRPLVHTLPIGRVDIGKELMDDERNDIKDAALVNLFQLLIDSPQKTATEVVELAKEKGMLLMPTLGRVRSEYLGSLIDREIDVLAMQGALPPMPGILQEAKGEYEIVYDSPLTRLQRAEEAAGFMRTLETILSVVNVTQNPEPLDHLNWSVIVPEMAKIQGLPEDWMNGEDEIARIRGERAQRQAEQTAIQAAPAAAAMVKAAPQLAQGQ
jgi:hypothetical protein